jgi:imidazolonepropionase-like amidohydrolase
MHELRSGKVTGADPLKDALDGKMPLLAVSRTSFDITALLQVGDEFQTAAIIVGGQEAYKLADTLAERKVAVILDSMTTGAVTGAEETELCWNQAGILHQHGITIALAGGRLLDKARFARRFGLPEEEALRSITATPAQLLGIADRVGTIAEGCDADLVAFNGNPLQLTSRLEWLMVDGKILEQGN